jgi:hypothetical protein
VKNRQEGLIVQGLGDSHVSKSSFLRQSCQIFGKLSPRTRIVNTGRGTAGVVSRAPASGIADTAYLCLNLDCSLRNPATGTAAAKIIDELTFDRIRLIVGDDETAIKFVFREINCESVSALAA